jgi:8-oxo-dGTP pyrophosphatase MutT (NUDIX family)
MIRHFTVTAFVCAQCATLLHWHARNRMWLPPGGHIEPDEDAAQAALREALEEMGLSVEILPATAALPYSDPPQLPAPVTIMVEDIPETPGQPAHQHIDLIYFTRPRDRCPPAPTGWRWVDAATLEGNAALDPPGATAPAEVPLDVRALGLAAIAHARAAAPVS